MDKKETKENKPVAKNTKVAEFAVALSYSPKLKDTLTIDTFGVTEEGISGQLKLALTRFYEKCGDKSPKALTVLEALGVFTLSAPLEQEVQITVGGTRGYGPGATVWVEFGGNYRIHAFFQSAGKEE